MCVSAFEFLDEERDTPGLELGEDYLRRDLFGREDARAGHPLRLDEDGSCGGGRGRQEPLRGRAAPAVRLAVLEGDGRPDTGLRAASLLPVDLDDDPEGAGQGSDERRGLRD